MEQLIGNKIILRKAKSSDLDNIYNNVWKDYEIAKNMYWKTTENYDEAKDRLEKTINYQKENKYAYFVCLKDTDEAIGFAGVKQTYPNVYEESGICIATRFHNLGIGNEIINLLVDLVFNILHGDKFIYACMKDNYVSKQLCLKHGFRYYKTTHEIRAYDKLELDNDFYELTKEDYFKRKDFDFRLVKYDEFDKLMEVMNITFNFLDDHNKFEHILPKLYYKDNKNMLHMGAFKDDKLVGSIGLYFDKIFKDNKVLDVACVGAVSTLPEYRNLGIFTTLLNLIVNQAHLLNIPLLFLGGKRQRYNHFGFENAGRGIVVSISRNKIKNYQENISIKKINKEDTDLINKCLDLYLNQESHLDRNINNMFDYMSSWNCISYAIYKDNKYVGYFCQNEENEIFELYCYENNYLDGLKAILLINEKINIVTSQDLLNKKDVIDNIDEYEYIFNHMVNILDYDKVADFYHFSDNYQEIIKDKSDLEKIRIVLGNENNDSLVGDNFFVLANDAG